MIATDTLQRNWPHVKDKLRQRWNQLTDEDLERWEGDVERLVRTIRKKTGDGREQVQDFLAELANNSGSAAHRAADAVSQYAQQITAKAQDVALDVAGAARAGAARTGQAVRHHPWETIGFSFVAGLVTGALLGLVLRSK